MSAMLARVARSRDVSSVPALHHRRAVDRRAVWRQLRAAIPDRAGVLILDGTSFPKQGTQSVGVARQYCGTLGKVANCQVAVTAALWTGVRAWMLGAALYLPEAWLTPGRRHAGAHSGDGPLSGEVAPGADAAAAGPRQRLRDDGGAGRCRIRRQRHAAPHVASRCDCRTRSAISSTLTVFRGTPRVAAPPRKPGRSRPRDAPAAGRRHASRTPSVDRRRSCQRGRGAASRGAMAPNRPWAPTSPRCASRRRTTGDGVDWRPKCGCSSNATSARRRAPRRTSLHLPAHRVAARRWCGWRITAGPSSSSTRN